MADDDPRARSDGDAVNARLPFRFTSEVSLGQILQAAVVAGGMLWTYGAYQAHEKSSVETAQHDISELKSDMKTQISELRRDVTAQLTGIQTANTEQFRNVQSDIANLPDVRATLTQLEKRMDQSDSRAVGQGGAIDAAQKLGFQNASDIAGILRAMTARGQR